MAVCRGCLHGEALAWPHQYASVVVVQSGTALCSVARRWWRRAVGCTVQPPSQLYLHAVWAADGTFGRLVGCVSVAVSWRCVLILSRGASMRIAVHWKRSQGYDNSELERRACERAGWCVGMGQF